MLAERSNNVILSVRHNPRCILLSLLDGTKITNIRC